jgi:hypothetical protein
MFCSISVVSMLKHYQGASVSSSATRNSHSKTFVRFLRPWSSHKKHSRRNPHGRFFLICCCVMNPTYLLSCSRQHCWSLKLGLTFRNWTAYLYLLKRSSRYTRAISIVVNVGILSIISRSCSRSAFCCSAGVVSPFNKDCVSSRTNI